MDDLKAGWKTSEFWLTLVSSGIGLALALHLISVTDAANLTSAATNGIGAVFVVLANVSAITSYVKGRIALKQLTISTAPEPQAAPPLPTVAVCPLASPNPQ